MSTYHSYEDMGTVGLARHCPALESFRGTDVVAWQGTIERQLDGFLDDMEKSRNWPYAEKIREFLRIWRDSPLTGSINREDLEALKTPADILAVDNWTFSNYFSNLRDRLRVLIASEEELPRDMDAGGQSPMRGTSRGAGSPPLNPQFGPEEEMPPGEEGAPEGEPEMPEPGEEAGGPPVEGEGPPEEEEPLPV